MIKLIIKEIKDNKYTLIGKEKIYTLDMLLYDINEFPKVGDYLIINEKLLDGSNTLYSFGALVSSYGRIVDENSEDLICLIINDKKIYLKRLYG